MTGAATGRGGGDPGAADIRIEPKTTVAEMTSCRTRGWTKPAAGIRAATRPWNHAAISAEADTRTSSHAIQHAHASVFTSTSSEIVAPSNASRIAPKETCDGRGQPMNLMSASGG